MKNSIFHLLSVCIIFVVCTACGVKTSDLPLGNTPVPSTLTTQTDQPIKPTQLIQPTATDNNSPKVAPGCEFLQFCVTSTIQGAVTSTATTGIGSNPNRNCTAWAAGDKARILELPLMLAAGPENITVALTRLGAYGGPGTYEMKATVSSGQPDQFPTVGVAGRTYSNGEGSTALVTIDADGSGSVEAKNLVELALGQGSTSDSSGKIDFSMQWTCTDIP